MNAITLLDVRQHPFPDRNVNLNPNLNLNPNPVLRGEIKIKRKSKIKMLPSAAAMLTFLSWPVFAAEISLESAPPVVVKTVPVAGSADVNPGLTEIKVTYSKAMLDGNWSWSTWGEENYPETAGRPRYLADQRTCVLPVKLKPGKFYAIWLNSDRFGNFKDANGQSAVPYLLTFNTASASPAGGNVAGGAFEHHVKPGDTLSRIVTSYREKGAKVTLEDILKANPGLDPTRLRVGQTIFIPKARGGGGGGAPAEHEQLLNDDQRTVLAWTDRQFRSFFDARTFDDWSDEERAALESKLVDALHGPRSTEYYQAINTLAAMRSTRALPRLREIAFERVDRNNRDRWMCIRALGILGDQESVPGLIHLVYHGNVNTRWWAQISLVRITGKNFAKDWNAWGKWWNGQNGQPPYKPEIIRWWNGQPEPDKLAESLEQSDQKFFESLKGQPGAAAAPAASTDVAARLRRATPVMEGIRGDWSATVEAIQREDATAALASVRMLAPRIQEFRATMQGTSLEAGAAEALETLKPLKAALERGNLEAARSALPPMTALGRKMEEQVKAITETSPVPAPAPIAGLAGAVVLQRDAGIQQGAHSIAASRLAVQFERPGNARYVEAVQIFGSRYGTPEAPLEDFHLYALNEQEQVLADVKFPYAVIERGDPKWYTLRTPSIEVPEKFVVALNFDAHETKGVYLAYSATNGVACHSRIGLPGRRLEFWKPVEWMVRVSLAAEPTRVKGLKRLADGAPPEAKGAHSLVGTVSDGFTGLPEREWMVRACFE